MHKRDLYAADQLVDCEQWYIHVQGVHVVHVYIIYPILLDNVYKDILPIHWLGSHTQQVQCKNSQTNNMVPSFKV